MKIVYPFKARQDLRDIYEYIAYTLMVPDTAQKMTEKIMQGDDLAEAFKIFGNFA